MPMDFPRNLGLTGDVSAVTLQDPDVDKNTVLEITQNWKVDTEWYVDGANVPFMGGTWHVSIIVESMGAGGEKTLKTIDVPITDTILGPHALNYKKTIEIPCTANAGPGEESITEEGIYKLVVLVTYSTAWNLVGRIAGFNEGLMVQFYNFQVDAP